MSRPLLPPPVQAALDQARSRWRALAPRERQLVSIAGLVLGLYAIWAIALAPAIRTVREAPGRIDRLDAELQHLRSLAAESRVLREVAPLAPSAATEALRSSTEALGAGAKLTLQGDRASVALTDIDPQALRTWLLEARSVARARPLEAQLSRTDKGYSGTVVVGIGGNP